MLVLTLNAGSSSLKFSLFDSVEEQQLLHGQSSWTDTSARFICRAGEEIVKDFELEWPGYSAALDRFVAELSLLLDGKNIELVAHRIVHGGQEFTQPVHLTPQVEATLERLVPLAPLHLPGAIRVIKAAGKTLPQIPHVAVFDTAFHATIPAAAAAYPIPQEWKERWTLRRFGFHGLSHEYCTARAEELLKTRQQEFRLVIAHIGSGVSITAVENGKSIDTTMGFTPLEGMMMATRCGNLDPGMMLHLQQECGLSLDELANGLNFQSGLLGVSGVSSDIRDVLEAAKQGHTASQLAFDIYVHRLRQGIASMTASLNGIDALVFTGGVGTHCSPVRTEVCNGLRFLGIEIEPEVNQFHADAANISQDGSHVQVLVIKTNEEIMLARHAVKVVIGE